MLDAARAEIRVSFFMAFSFFVGGCAVP